MGTLPEGRRKEPGRPTGFAALLAGVLTAAATSAGAQTLSTPSLSNASSANESATGNCKYARRSSVSLVSSSSSSFQTRYIATVAADNDSNITGCAQRIETLNSDYTVAFTATAPRLYRLQVDTTRSGDINTRDDGGGANNDARADQGPVSCAQTGGTVVSGGCTLADPGPEIIGGNNNQAYNQTNSLILCGSSNGSPVSHTLNFTWTQLARSDSTGIFGNADEGAVRLGDDFGLTGETASDYPGTPARTQAADGHFLTVTITNLCGNGVVDTCGSASEECDQGALNGTPGSCCNANCTFRSAGAVCRPSAGVCDLTETCTGASGTCPADGKSTAVCRPAADVCDVAERL